MKRNNVCHSDLLPREHFEITKTRNLQNLFKSSNSGVTNDHQDQKLTICLNLPIQESPMITKVEVLHWWMLLFSKSQLEINNNNMILHVCFVHMLQLQENHK